MPWSVSDVEKHRKGLTPEEKKKWVVIANGVLDDCIKKGGTDKTCAPKAIRIANSKFSEEIPNMKKEQIPSNAFLFMDHEARAEVFIEGEGKIPKLRMTAYSGKIIPNHFWWGDLAFDISGMKLTKKRLPILSDHETDKKIAFTDKVLTEDNKIVIDPESTIFVDTPESKEFIQLSREGFPYESSVRMQPLKIQRLAEKETAEVNGFTMKGPGTIIREWNLKEASVCVFGYDSNTQSKAFSEKVDLTYTDVSVEVKNLNLKEVKTMTLEELKRDNPELYAEMQKEIKDAVMVELTAPYEAEVKRLKDLIASLENEKKSVDEKILALEKRDELRTEKELKAEAESIWNGKLAESQIPERLYAKVKNQVSVDSFIKDRVLDSAKFAEAVAKEIKDWEDSGAKKEVMGIGSRQKEEEGSEDKTKLDEENKQASSNLLSIAGYKAAK